MSSFTEVHPSLESYWRAVILFGRNVASYKFALAQSLIELASRGKALVTLEELAVPFSRRLCEHLKANDKQGSFATSRFLDACRKSNAGEIGDEGLIDTTVKLGFNNVIDAFHMVNAGPIGVRFYADERSGPQRGIRLTDDLFRLAESGQWSNLPHEVEARWRLVETAWGLDLPRHVLVVGYDSEGEMLVIDDRRLGRKAITGCRGALNGYQKGKCFYCFGDIGVDDRTLGVADVDHFFPHVLKGYGLGDLTDGVWNLVLACPACNRGEDGKFARLPELRHLERLHRRNEFLIDSQHPLRETLISQVGATEPLRRSFLQATYTLSKGRLIHSWRPRHEHEPAF